VAELIDETMGLMPMVVLFIFIRKYSCAGLGWASGRAGGRQYLMKQFLHFLVGLFYLGEYWCVVTC